MNNINETVYTIDWNKTYINEWIFTKQTDGFFAQHMPS